jgi:hypothetical protein
MKMRIDDPAMRTCALLGSVSLLCVVGCGAPDGTAEFKRSQRAVQQLDRITIEWTNTTALGVFTEIAEFDCGTSSSYDPTAECDGLRQGKDTPFVPFKRILEADAIRYQSTHAFDGIQCHEYEVTYPDVVYTDNMKTVQLGPGSSYSERETATKPVKSVISLGAKDLLPRQVVKGDQRVKFSYGLIVPLADPAHA